MSKNKTGMNQKYNTVIGEGVVHLKDLLGIAEAEKASYLPKIRSKKLKEKGSGSLVNFSEPLHMFENRIEIILYKPGTSEYAGTCTFGLQLLQIPSFLDYISGGMKIQMHYAIDFNHFEDDEEKDPNIPPSVALLGS